MPEVQNVGAVDYAQYQPSQYQTDAYVEDYGNAPEVYDEHAAEMKAASKSRLGATLLGSAIVAGLAYWGGHAMGKKGAKAEMNKAAEAIKKYEEAQKTMEEAQKAMEDIEKAAIDGNTNKWFGENHCGNKLCQKIEEAFKPYKKVAEDAKEGSENSVEVVDDAAKELEEHATDANK